MRPKPVKLSATTSEKTEQLGPALRGVLIKNIGTTDCYIDFDNAIDTDNSYVLESGEHLTVEWDFIQLHYQTASGTTTLHLIKVIQ